MASGRRSLGAGIGLYLTTLAVVLALNFALPRFMPGDPLDQLADPSSGRFIGDDPTRDRVLSYYGLDLPLPEQFARYLAATVRGDLGFSIGYSAPVGEVLVARLPWTLLLVLGAIAIASVIAVVAGVEAGWARGTKRDTLLVGFFLIVESVPVFVLGIVLIVVFAVQLGWLPLGGAYRPFGAGTPFDRALDVAAHLVLPLVTLALSLIGAKFLLVRASVVSILREDYIAVARAKGLPERLLKYRHALRNALLPFVTQLSVQVGFAVGGAVLVETLFAYPGMGRLLFDAVAYRDYPLLQGALLVISVTVLAANLVMDRLYARLDPRVAAP